MTLEKDELMIEILPKPKTGGMHVPRIGGGVRITHIPTGKVSESTQHRSQYHNRRQALMDLEELIMEQLHEK